MLVLEMIAISHMELAKQRVVLHEKDLDMRVGAHEITYHSTDSGNRFATAFWTISWVNPEEQPRNNSLSLPLIARWTTQPPYHFERLLSSIAKSLMQCT